MPRFQPETLPIDPGFAGRPLLMVAVDVGNSRTKFGLLEVKQAKFLGRQLPKVVDTLAIRHGKPLPWNELRMWLGGCSGTLATILAGVNPEGVQRILQEWPPELPAPIQIQDYQQLGLTIAVDFAEKVGIDRLLNAVAARHFATSGRPVLVIDSGTATTVDRVSAEGVFEGGAILPGLELSGLALHHYTALLPQILPEELSPAGVAPQPLGRNTRDAIRSGLFWGQVGAVRELIRKLSSREVKPVVLVTGGAAPLLVPQLQDDFEIHSEEYLPLKGLALVGCRLGYSSQP